MRQSFLVLRVHRLGHPDIECDLELATVRIEVLHRHVQVTFSHVTKSWLRLDSSLNRVPITAAVGSTATEIEMLLYPEAESPVLILSQIVTGTLRSELFAEPIEHWGQVLFGEFLMLFPSGYDGRLEFLFAEFRWVSLIGVSRFVFLRFIAVRAD